MFFDVSYFQVGNSKISAVGISVTRWVTFHGIALNIDCDMNNFSNIIPCGITDHNTSVSSMQQLLQQSVQKSEVVAAVKSSFQDVLGVQLVMDTEPHVNLQRTVENNPLPQSVLNNMVSLK